MTSNKKFEFSDCLTPLQNRLKSVANDFPTDFATQHKLLKWASGKVSEGNKNRHKLRRFSYGGRQQKSDAKAHIIWIFETQISVTNYQRNKNPSQISERILPSQYWSTNIGVFMKKLNL